jgi:predicted NUDIX family NTP pyrophosphohydrolase
MAKHSAGLLMYRVADGAPEVLLVHPGGPFFAKKDEGAWTIPKGELDAGEDALACAKRELQEETGIALPDTTPDTTYAPLGSIKQAGGKVVQAWAFEGDWNGVLVSNTFELEWPPRSGKKRAFPEVDRAAFLTIEEARRKMNPAQAPFLDRLLALLHQA